MRFYGQTYSEVMRLPLRTFWSLSANVVRVRAEENLATMELYLLGGMGASEEALKSMRDTFQKQMGDTVSVSSKPKGDDNDETQRTGLASLRKLKGKMVN